MPTADLPTTPFLLSDAGSTRATAYCFGNKSVRIGEQTHVVWLDAIAKVRGRTFDHGTGHWSETFDLFEGCDNHTNPALTADAEGHLRLAYGPHVRGWNEGRFKWRRSTHPNRIDAWEKETDFGYGATYACLVHLPEGRDAIAYRGGDYPLAAMFQKQRALGGWTPAKPIFRQEIVPQYTHYGAHLAAAPDGTLYFAAHFYNNGLPQKGPHRKSFAQSHGHALLRSADGGETWTDLRGEPVATPALYHERYAVPPYGADRRVEGLVLDARGLPWMLSTCANAEDRTALLIHWDGAAWKSLDLAQFLPAERNPTGGSLTIDTRGALHVALMAFDENAYARDPDPATWGHPSLEVFHLRVAPNLKEVAARQVSPADPATPHWLPSLSQPGLHHPVERPLLVYTAGVKGEGCTPPDRTRVYALWV
ncbi:MAG: BNR repeat-containing protein [Planctomycetota bacterium]|nr:BNR repeat-containing protein [Planctomycetota bacterium]